MKKPLLLFCMYFALIIGSLAFTLPAQASEISITIDGQRVETDTPPVIKDGRTFVPFRAIFEALGAGEIFWQDYDNTVAAHKGATAIYIPIGKKEAQICNDTVELDVPAFIENGRTMVPVRFASEALGCKVNWDAATRTVVITSPVEKTDPNMKLNLLIDGKPASFTSQCYFCREDWEAEEGTPEYLVVPFEPFVKALNPICEIEGNTIRTNTEMYTVEVDGDKFYVDSVYYSNPNSSSLKFNNIVNGVKFADAEYMAEEFEADYKCDLAAKTVKITTASAKAKNSCTDPTVFVIDDYAEAGEIVKEFLLTNLNPDVNVLYFYPTFVVKDDAINPSWHTQPLIEYLSRISCGSYGDDTRKLVGFNIIVRPVSNDEIKAVKKPGLVHLKIDYDFYSDKVDNDDPIQILINKKVDEIVADIIKPGMSDREKIKALFDYVVDNTEYNWDDTQDDGAKDTTAYGPLFLGEGQCIGYANALYFLLTEVGFEAQMYGGILSNDAAHVWARVKLNGQWYHLDPTFADNSGGSKWFMRPEAEVLNDPIYKTF